jgi:protein-arginine kinase
VHNVAAAVVNRLMLQTQPGHLQRLARRTLESNERDELRSDMIRRELASAALAD